MSTPGPAALLRDVGRRVAELRAARGWTQEAFAEQAEVSVGYVRQVEAGRENLSLKSLAKLAELLGVQVLDLFAPPAPRTTKRGRPPRRQAEQRAGLETAGHPSGGELQGVVARPDAELDRAIQLSVRLARSEEARGGAEWVASVATILEALGVAVANVRNGGEGPRRSPAVGTTDVAKGFIEAFLQLSRSFLEREAVVPLGEIPAAKDPPRRRSPSR